MHTRKAIVVSVLVFAGIFTLRYFLLHFYHFSEAGDFVGPLALARNILRGADPYSGINFVPYPLPAGLIALPFAWMSDRLAGSLFFGLTAGILAGALVWRTGQVWRLLLMLSLPFVVSMEWTQWSPLIMAAWYIPVLAPLLVTIKPQIALPVFVNRWAGYGYLAAVLVLIASLIISPSWPLRWAGMLNDYQHVYPLLLPGGFLLLLALLNLSDRRARLLLVMAILPVRATYDLVPLFIFAETPLQLLVLIAATWLTPPFCWFLLALLYVLLSMNIQDVKQRIFLFFFRFRESLRPARE